jgi:Na+-driven multidrug efflux pump
VRKAALLNVGCVALIAIVILAGRYQILSLYTGNESMIHDSYPVLYAVVAAIFMCAIAWVHVQAVTGIGSTRFVLITEIVSVLFYISHVIIMVRLWHTPLAVVWLAEPIYYVVAFTLNYIYLHRKKWLTAEMLQSG